MQVKHTHTYGDLTMTDGSPFLSVGTEVEEGGPRGSTRGPHYLPLCEHFPAVLKATGSRYHDRCLYIINKIILSAHLSIS